MTMSSVQTNGGRSVTNADFARTGPGTLAGRYLRMFWQPVARSQDVAAGQATVRIMVKTSPFASRRGRRDPCRCRALCSP